MESFCPFALHCTAHCIYSEVEVEKVNVGDSSLHDDLSDNCHESLY